MRKVKINRTDLELTFEVSSYDVNAYLDIETGAVIYVEKRALHRLDEILDDEEALEAALDMIQAQTDLSNSERAQIMDAAHVEWDTEGRYRQIPKQDSEDGYRDMQEFIWSLQDQHLRELLEVAIHGQGAFCRFKDVLYHYPEMEANWFWFRDEREQRRLLDWLASEDIEPEFE